MLPPLRHRGFRKPWLVAVGAVCACLSFLAFPQSIAAFAVLWIGMVILGRRGGEARFLGIPRGAWVLLGSCAVCGVAFLVWTLQGMGFDLGAFLARVGLILHDPQYNFTAGERLALLAQQALPVLQSWRWPLAMALVAYAVAGLRKVALPERRCLCAGTVGHSGHAAVRAARRQGRQPGRTAVCAGAGAGRGLGLLACPQAARRGALFWLGYLPGLAAYAFILRSTLLGLPATFMYLTWPALCGLLMLLRVRPPTARAALGAVLVFLAACRVWCVQTTGWKGHTVADTPLVMIENGPAKGIRADEKAADMQQCLYEALAPYAGQGVLQAIGEQHGLGFLMADGTLTVNQASVISGTDSDPRFIQYYEEMPKNCPTSSSMTTPRCGTWRSSMPGSRQPCPLPTGTP